MGLDTSSSEEWKANTVSHLGEYISAIWKVPSPSQPDSTKERLTPALPGISHNDTEENQDFTPVVLHRPNAQQNSVHFFPGECETTKVMPMKLSKTNTQYFSEITFIFFTLQLKLPETSYTCVKGSHHPHPALWGLCHCGYTTDTYQHWRAGLRGLFW